MAEKSSIFDMIGPIMIGPSSSHTAGVVRIGRVARQLLGNKPEQVEILFYNSFSTTYQGHGSDRAVLAGLMDLKTDDLRIRDAIEIAKEEGIKFAFKPMGTMSTLHPNSIIIKASAGDREVKVLGQSLGGGVINISEVNGYNSSFSSGLYTLVIEADDVKGSIAFLSNILMHDDCNIATMSCGRKAKNDTACLIYEIDSSIRPLTLDYMRHLAWVHHLTYFEPLD